MTFFHDLFERVGKTAHDHGFGAGENIHRSLLLMVGEIVEAQNELRTFHAPTEVYYSRDDQGQEKPEGVPVEIVDNIIRSFNLLKDLGFDGHAVEQLILLKDRYNATRPPKHGKAF